MLCKSQSPRVYYWHLELHSSHQKDFLTDKMQGTLVSSAHKVECCVYSIPCSRACAKLYRSLPSCSLLTEGMQLTEMRPVIKHFKSSWSFLSRGPLSPPYLHWFLERKLSQLAHITRSLKFVHVIFVVLGKREKELVLFALTSETLDFWKQHLILLWMKFKMAKRLSNFPFAKTEVMWLILRVAVWWNLLLVGRHPHVVICGSTSSTNWLLAQHKHT